jgi:methylenetetrahydrofolate dehydrogenase (NADP+)/methenyltetrahydrofolate cyclohydrolase
MSLLLLKENGTVTTCHSKTEDLASITKEADIIVSAIGKAKFVTADMVKPHAVIIDVGMNRDEEGNLCGDCDYDALFDICDYITPVPGGVGPMTIAILMKNVLFAFKKQKG